jgi:hypothetical protein
VLVTVALNNGKLLRTIATKKIKEKELDALLARKERIKLNNELILRLALGFLKVKYLANILYQSITKT